MTCRVRPSPKRGNAVLQKKGNRRLHFFHLSFHTFFTPFATSIDPHHITKNTHIIHRQLIRHCSFVFSNLNLPVFYELFEFKLSPWLLWIVQMFCEFSSVFMWILIFWQFDVWFQVTTIPMETHYIIQLTNVTNATGIVCGVSAWIDDTEACIEGTTD